MKPLKKLALKKDTLAELGTDELRGVVGGIPTGLSVTTQDTSTLVLCNNTGYYLTIPIDGCIHP
jgi:hypothetical protein